MVRRFTVHQAQEEEDTEGDTNLTQQDRVPKWRRAVVVILVVHQAGL
jgi:hypothetical protein